MNYRNDRATYSTYITEMAYQEITDDLDLDDLIAARDKEERVVSDLVIRGALSYNERLRALEQPAPWKIVHGELFPFELRSGLGKLQALPVALKLFREISKQPTIGSVVSDTSSVEINYGYALEPYEYFIFKDLKDEYADWLKVAKFNPEDKKTFATFAETTAAQYIKAVYRVGDRPFLFYAHKDRCDEFAAILCEDSSLIPERGFPLLVDYADTVCSSLFRAGDFERRVSNELALTGSLLQEQSERASRAR